MKPNLYEQKGDDLKQSVMKRIDIPSQVTQGKLIFLNWELDNQHHSL
jgi:hypothetical protein